MRRRGQTSTETMLLVSVLIVALVGAAYAFAPEFETAMVQFSSGAKTVYATPE